MSSRPRPLGAEVLETPFQTFLLPQLGASGWDSPLFVDDDAADTPSRKALEVGSVLT